MTAWFNSLWESACNRWQYFWLERATDPWFLGAALGLLVVVILLAWAGKLFRFPNGVTGGRVFAITLFVFLVIILGFRGLFGLLLLCPWFVADDTVVLWLLLLIPVVLFYFLKLKRPRVEISSLALWKTVLNDQRVNSPFQRFRRSILLWLQLAILLLLVLAAMQPIIQGGAGRAEYLPILIDTSASMSARDAESGKTRLDLAKAQIRDLVENMVSGQRVSLISMHSTAQRLTEFTDNRRVLLDALEKVTVRDVPSRLDDGLRMTQALARTVPIDRVLIYSDGNFPERINFELPFQLGFQQIEAAGSNVGITAFNAQQTTAPEWDVFLRVEASETSSGTVKMLQDGREVGEETFVLDKGESQRLTFNIVSEVSTRLEAKLSVDAGEYDALATDNSAWLDLPTPRPLRVYVDPDLDSYRRALPDSESLDIYPDEGAGDSQRSIPFDLVYSDKATDKELDATVRVFTGVIPADLTDLVDTKSDLVEVIDWDQSSPFLQHMQLRDVHIMDDVHTKPGVDDGDFEDLGYTILAHCRNGPVIVQKRVGSELNVYTLFHTERSTLPFKTAFPILVTNGVQIAFHEAAIGEVRGAKTKTLPVREMSPNAEYVVRDPSGNDVKVQADENGMLNGVAAPLAGRYQILDGGDEAASISVSLLDTMETSLSQVNEIQFNELSVGASEELLDSDRPLWSTLAMVAFVILLAEWWFFQRPPVID